jgi:ADP-ribose pyrophosphatase YjhB (NUDIX family)
MAPLREIQRDIVSALIFAKDGKLFQGMKEPRKGGVYSDCWHIPGGGVEEDESKEEALKKRGYGRGGD